MHSLSLASLVLCQWCITLSLAMRLAPKRNLHRNIQETDVAHRGVGAQEVKKAFEGARQVEAHKQGVLANASSSETNDAHRGVGAHVVQAFEGARQAEAYKQGMLANASSSETDDAHRGVGAQVAHALEGAQQAEVHKQGVLANALSSAVPSWLSRHVIACVIFPLVIIAFFISFKLIIAHVSRGKESNATSTSEAPEPSAAEVEDNQSETSASAFGAPQEENETEPQPDEQISGTSSNDDLPASTSPPDAISRFRSAPVLKSTKACVKQAPRTTMPASVFKRYDPIFSDGSGSSDEDLDLHHHQQDKARSAPLQDEDLHHHQQDKPRSVSVSC